MCGRPTPTPTPTDPARAAPHRPACCTAPPCRLCQWLRTGGRSLAGVCCRRTLCDGVADEDRSGTHTRHAGVGHIRLAQPVAGPQCHHKMHALLLLARASARHLQPPAAPHSSTSRTAITRRGPGAPCLLGGADQLDGRRLGVASAAPPAPLARQSTRRGASHATLCVLATTRGRRRRAGSRRRWGRGRRQGRVTSRAMLHCFSRQRVWGCRRWEQRRPPATCGGDVQFDARAAGASAGTRQRDANVVATESSARALRRGDRRCAIDMPGRVARQSASRQARALHKSAVRSPNSEPRNSQSSSSSRQFSTL